MGPRFDHERGVQVRAPAIDRESRIEPSRRTSRILQRRRGGNCQRAKSRGGALTRHRRQSGRIERRRHVDATSAGTPSRDAARRAARRARHRPRQRRHRRRRPRIGRSSPSRHRRDLARGGRSIGVLCPRKSRRLAQSCRAPARRRRPVAPATVCAPVRCHRLGAVQPLDGRRLRALHARVFRGRARAIAIGRHLLPVVAHLRDRRYGSAIDRGHLRVCLS